MGSRGDSGASGSDAGFENTQKSKLSKKNQKKVDTAFNERGKLNIEDQMGKVTTPLVARVLSGPLKAGSKVNRDFFTDKVLGSKNYRGTSKADFEAMTVSQQENIFGDYMQGRMSGQTDAYGNQIGSGRDDSPMAARTKKKSIKSVEQPKVSSQMNAVKPGSTPDGPTSTEVDQENYNIDVKRRGRKRTVLTSITGDTSTPKLSKKVLLGG